MLYIKEADVPITKNRKNLVRYFLRGKIIPTYSDKECTVLQCDGKGESGRGASRSFTDLHEIVKSRFPKTSLDAIVKIVYEFMGEDTSIIVIWCKLIKKVVLQFSDNKSGTWISAHSKQNFYQEIGIDGYSLEYFENIKNKIKK